MDKYQMLVKNLKIEASKRPNFESECSQQSYALGALSWLAFEAANGNKHAIETILKPDTPTSMIRFFAQSGMPPLL